MKRILGIFCFAFVLSIFIAGNASANMLAEVKADEASGKLTKYMSSGHENYGLIEDTTAREQVEEFCQMGCTRFSCREKEIALSCKKYCPARDIRNCLRSDEEKGR